MLRWRTIDDRGRAVRIAWLAPVVPRAGEGPGRTLVRSVLSGVRGVVLTRATLAIVLLLAALGLLGVGLGVMGPMVGMLLMFSPVASLFILLVATSVSTVGGVLSGRAETVKRAWLEAGRCPACRYSVAGLEKMADERVVCPECSAAWAVDEVGASAGREPRVIVVSGGLREGEIGQGAAVVSGGSAAQSRMSSRASVPATITVVTGSPPSS